MTFAFHGAPARAEEPTVEEVVVTGTRTPRALGEAPVAVELIDRAAILASGSRDLADLLEQHPGVQVTRSFLGAAIALRGLEATHTLVLVDGHRVVGRKDGTFDLSRIPVDAIEQIEIVKGASSALYGSDALGGVVNIVTRRARAPVESDVSARGVSPLGGDVSAGLGLRGDATGMRLDLGWHGNAPGDADPTDAATTTNAVRQVDGSLAVDWRPGPDVTWSARGAWSGTDARGVDLGVGGGVLDRRNLTEDGLVRGEVDVVPDARSRWRTSLGASIFRDQYLSDQRGAAALDDYQETQETLVQADSQLDRVLGPHVGTVGVEATFGLLRSDRLAGGSGQRQTAGVYVQDEVRALREPRLVLVPGARGDVDSWFGGAVAPSLGLRLDPAEPLTLRASAGVGWRAPSFRELLLSFDNASVGYRVEGNPDLRPERSVSATVGAEWNPAEMLSATVSAHVDRVLDLIGIATLEETAGSIRFGYDNLAEARVVGLDLGGSLDLSDHVTVDLGGTWLDARDLRSGRPLEGRAALQGTSSATLRTGRDGPALVSRASVVGPRPFFPEDRRVDAPAYALLDLRVAWPLDDATTVSVGLDNALDAGDPAYLPVPPRQFYAGVDARLAGGAR